MGLGRSFGVDSLQIPYGAHKKALCSPPTDPSKELLKALSCLCLGQTSNPESTYPEAPKTYGFGFL